jgi:hypothetical protein
MSSRSDPLVDVVARLHSSKVVNSTITADKGCVVLNGIPVLNAPKESRAWSWRTTVNRSLLPASVSPENRRHLLYAVLQDLLPESLRLKENTASVSALAEMDSHLSMFDDVYRVPAEHSSDRIILFPIHIAVPAVFDTYLRQPTQKPQTDKGFRGRFIDFFSTDETGFFDDHLHRVLRNLFSRTDEMTPLDRALVRALSKRVAENRRSKLAEMLGVEPDPMAVNPDWWGRVFTPLPTVAYRPMPDFVDQGQRLHRDIDAIAHTNGLSRIERIAFIERLLAYHFSLFMVRLTRSLYTELDWAYRTLWPGAPESPWAGQTLSVRYHDRRQQVPRRFNEEYRETANRLNEAYLLLPLLNNIELAIRACGPINDDKPVKMSQCCWVEAKAMLTSLSAAQLADVRQVLSVLAELGRTYVGISGVAAADPRLASEPIEMLFDAIRIYYSSPSQRRYPQNHHQNVFDTIAGTGDTSFLQNTPYKHFVIGDDLLYLLVLALFECRDDNERSDSTCLPREANKLRRRRIPLKQLDERLKADLLIPADIDATRHLRASLSRLGLLERLSDVGDGNFLRHPTGV